MAKPPRKTILLVEDEMLIAMAEKRTLERNGYSVVIAHTGEQAVEICTDSDAPIGLILMDVELGTGMDGTEAAERILEKRDLPVVFLSSHTEPEIVEKTERITSYGYILKNAGETVLLASIKMAFRLHEAHSTLETQKEELNNVLVERERSEAAALEKHQELRTTLESIADAVLSTDRRGRVVLMNPPAERLCGWNRDEAQGKSLDEVFHIVNARTRRPMENPVARVMQTGRTAGLANDTALIARDGHEYQIADSAAPVKDDEGNVVGVVLVFRDVTEQYLKDARLRERVKELECLYRIAEITEEPGAALDDMLQEIAEAVPPSWRYPESTVCRIVIDEDEYRSREFKISRRMQRADVLAGGRQIGSIEVYYIDERPLPDEGPFLPEEARLLEAIAERVGTTIARKRAEAALSRERLLLSTVLDALHAAVVICGTDGRIVRFNEAARRLHGLPEEPVPSEQWAEHYDLYATDGETPLPTEEIPLFRAYRGERVRNAEIVVSPKGGSPRLLRCEGGPLVDGEGEKHGAVIAMHDITEQREAEQEARTLAEEKARLLKEVQHRIKNTMGTMAGMLSLEAESLQNKPDAAAALTDARNRFQAMEKLYELLYRSESHITGSLGNYLTQLLNSHRALFSAGRRVTITTDMEELELDAKRLSKVGIIVNELLTNAMKHAFPDRTDGRLFLSARRIDRRIAITVSDDGPGLPDFAAGEGEPSFGMMVVEALAGELNGTVRFEQDEGLRVTLEFPE